MAVDVARPPQGTAPAPVEGNWLVRQWRALVNLYHGVMVEMKKVTWPDRGQVRQATIAIIIFVLAIALFITALDWIMSTILVRVIPSLLGR